VNSFDDDTSTSFTPDRVHSIQSSFDDNDRVPSSFDDGDEDDDTEDLISAIQILQAKTIDTDTLPL
jgi:hypothetical protein